MKYVDPNSLEDVFSKIYEEEFAKSINGIKRMREIHMRSKGDYNENLFQYADNDFYMYRFFISRIENNTLSLIRSILYRMLCHLYSVSKIDKEISFILNDSEKKIGFRFLSFDSNEEIAYVFNEYNVDYIYVVNTYPDEWNKRDNRKYSEQRKLVRNVSVKFIFRKFFSLELYDSFCEILEKYLSQVRAIVGYHTVIVLTWMNQATLKANGNRNLIEFDYENYQYQIIDRKNVQQDLYYLENDPISNNILNRIYERYKVNSLYNTMNGDEEYSESFLTSEWLFHSFEGKKNFDYTSIITGYLKSVEQLLKKIVMLHIDNKNYKITMSKKNDILEEIKKEKVPVYKWEKDTWQETKKIKDYRFIEFTYDNLKYMDSSMGTYEIFLRHNPEIFITPTVATIIADMIKCFRDECRNEYLHTHNLHDWNIVKKTRENAIYLYFLLLGACTPESSELQKGEQKTDFFDKLCIKLREYSRISGKFVFRIGNDQEYSVVYDHNNNPIEYSTTGEEHYEKLIFYSVKDFSDESYEELNTGVSKEQIIYLTRTNLPAKIFHVKRTNEVVEIEY